MSTPRKPKTTNANQLIDLKKKIKELEDRLFSSEDKNMLLEKRIELLETSNAVIKKVNTELVKELDRVDQYSRRSNVIMKNVLLPENENQKQLEKKIKSIISNDIKLPTTVTDIENFIEWVK